MVMFTACSFQMTTIENESLLIFYELIFLLISVPLRWHESEWLCKLNGIGVSVRLRDTSPTAGDVSRNFNKAFLLFDSINCNFYCLGIFKNMFACCIL